MLACAREVLEHGLCHAQRVGAAERGVQRQCLLHLEPHVVGKVPAAAQRQRAHHGVERLLRTGHVLAQGLLVELAAESLLAGSGHLLELLGHVGAGVLVV